ncbi:MAG: cobalt transport protein [Synechococcales cyanobacterium RM1_1_8]|nr:cobalt transport protein [Synechococcales cyanobacterium RM1_1_8]
MSDRPTQLRYGTFFLSGLGIALGVAVLVSPFASPSPDGLNRVAEDLEFADKEHPDPPAKQLPFAQIFDGYALKGVPEAVATPVAGLAGTLVTFGLAWGAGKLLVRKSQGAD